MAQNYHNLYEHIKSLVQIDNPCLICHQSNNNSIKLECTHEFHEDCFFEYSKKKIKTCPYCLKISNNIIKIENKCIAILKSGLKKGTICNRKTTGNYCSYHNKLNS